MGGIVAPFTSGLAKSGNGTLLLNAQNHYQGETRINLGTIQLGATAPSQNALFYRFTEASNANTAASTLRADNFVVQGGGTFDLNGKSQSVGSIASSNSLPGAGGIITNTAIGGAVNFHSLTTAALTFSGSLAGNLNFLKSGGNTTTLTDNHSHTGTTTILGGLTILQDQARFSGGSAVTVNRSVLRWDDTGLQALNNRLTNGALAVTNANSSNIVLNGGALQFNSRSGFQGVATFGDLTLESGASLVAASIGLTGTTQGIGSATMSFGSLSRSTTNATISFHGLSGIVGQNPYVKFATAPTLNNGIIGAWATVIGANPSYVGSAANAQVGIQASFATYDPVNGIMPLSASQYDFFFAPSTLISGVTTLALNGIGSAPTANVRIQNDQLTTGTALTANLPSGGATINTLTIGGLDNAFTPDSKVAATCSP